MANSSNDITLAALRIHPAIGMARVGNSDEYYLGPESLGGIKTPGKVILGGLPIKPGTEDDNIDSGDVRDDDGKLKKQAARFRIFHYPSEDITDPNNPNTYNYPSAPDSSEEIKIGSTVCGKEVTDIIWTVHLGNKKANCWGIDDDLGLKLYEYPVLMNQKLRNPAFGADYANADRISKLVIDAGPRAVRGQNANSVNFDRATISSYASDTGNGTIVEKPDYKTNWPAWKDGVNPADPSQPIGYLGALKTDADGRLLVLAGHGKACRFDNSGNYSSVDPNDKNVALSRDVDNNNWLDDTSDGPVSAVLVFSDGTAFELASRAWVVCTDPSYAPQTANIVSLWDELYNSWIQHPETNLMPQIYNDGNYNTDYQPFFREDVHPIFNAAHMQMWNTALNGKAFVNHKMASRLSDAPPRSGYNIMVHIRKPSDNGDGTFPDPNITKKMPLGLGDAGQAFLTVTDTQYFLMEQWQNGKAEGVQRPPLAKGEFLDKAVLFNCLGGRFSPGIDITFIIRDIHMYDYQNYHDPRVGAFRINARRYDYAKINAGQPGIGVGYVPLSSENAVEPGDLCKFMAIPWHTDYNSCALHIPYPNPGSVTGTLTNNEPFSNTGQTAPNTTLFWSWPAQRPVSVYTLADYEKHLTENPSWTFYGPDGSTPQMDQRYSVRGDGTSSNDVKSKNDKDETPYESPAMEVGRYQRKVQILDNWSNVGIIMQLGAIEGHLNEEGFVFLEVGSNFTTDYSNKVEEYPYDATDAAPEPEA